jgi:hypothetical protein
VERLGKGVVLMESITFSEREGGGEGGGVGGENNVPCLEFP